MMKILSPLPRPTTLVSARDHVHAGAGGGPSDRLDHALEIRDRQALLEDEREREVEGLAPPMARSFTVPLTASSPMSPPGKEDGRHHVGVGGEGQPGAPNDRMSLVVEPLERRVAEAGRMIFSIRRAVSLPPAAVPEEDAVLGAGARHGAFPEGRRKSEDIVLSHGDVDLVPEQCRSSVCDSCTRWIDQVLTVKQ